MLTEPLSSISQPLLAAIISLAAREGSAIGSMETMHSNPIPLIYHGDHLTIQGYAASGKTIFKIGVSFSSETRGIAEWKIN